MESTCIFTASYNEDTKELDVNLRKGDEEDLKQVAYAIYGKLSDQTAREKIENLAEEIERKEG